MEPPSRSKRLVRIRLVAAEVERVSFRSRVAVK